MDGVLKTVGFLKMDGVSEDRGFFLKMGGVFEQEGFLIRLKGLQLNNYMNEYS